MAFKYKLFYIILFLCFVASIVFIHNNYSFYERPIAKVVEVELQDKTEIVDGFENKDTLFTQYIIAEIKNGEEKGSLIHLVNEYSASKAYDYEFRVGNELFVKIDANKQEDTHLTGTIIEVKRDKYILIAAWLFVFILLLVGKKQGLFSIFSLIINAILLSYALDFYLNKPDRSLLLICSIGIILFTILSLLLVNGLNEKTYSAIIATLIGTFVSLAVAYVVITFTSGKGLRYEELQFITRPYKTVFMAGLFIGSLGAVMDVAITMSSTIFGLYEKNNNISIKALVKSGMEVGRDIMGTMTNILFFAYISGSIPLLILYFKNASPLGFTLNMNLSLELARALAGGIGIALTIPIGLYTTIFFVSRKRARS
ncbi:YibE/F family protein [Fredinandcohnia sp. QZ13]|uniref:YibE/F family protein n=1 Tax=Fredinandcohnia sp. QZ13 TaxID=3073144 RepID=UPI0028531F3D|nr:YibE/F family protein [Fredinandcohnia sp. QZ13]MDR4889891.1 YibE/F family protein [Fredinandcohnia sp. QZ13]